MFYFLLKLKREIQEVVSTGKKHLNSYCNEWITETELSPLAFTEVKGQILEQELHFSRIILTKERQKTHLVLEGQHTVSLPGF